MEFNQSLNVTWGERNGKTLRTQNRFKL